MQEEICLRTGSDDMADIEKVIKGLECCKAIHIYLCNDCPYHDDDVDDNNCKESLCADALELLKEGK